MFEKIKESLKINKEFNFGDSEKRIAKIFKNHKQQQEVFVEEGGAVIYSNEEAAEKSKQKYKKVERNG